MRRPGRLVTLVAGVLAGLATCAALPGVGLGWLAWVALVPLVAAIDRAASTGRALGIGLAYGIARDFPLLVWIPPVLVRYGDIPGWLAWLLYTLLVGALGLFPGIAAAATSFARRGLGAGGLLVFPAVWVAVELGRDRFPFGGFPWLQLGYSQTESLGLIQVADLCGVYGVSFLVASVNVGLAVALARRGPVRLRLLPIGASAALVSAAVLYGAASLERLGRIEPDRTAALLQGNLAFEDPGALLAWKSREGYVELAAGLSGQPVDLGVLPESPAPLSYQGDAPYREVLRGLARRFTLGLIFNNTRFAGREESAEYYNSAYFLSAAGEEAGRYDKTHLVPFGEYVPLARLFFFAQSITKDVSAFTPGSALAPVVLGGHAIGGIICFESIFPDIARGLVRGGGELLVNLTNDAWYGATAAPRQHLAMARWRAVENRRYLLRAANSGISAVIAPSGRIESATPLFTRGVCVGRFAFLSERSLYTRRGDAFAWLCVIISVLAGGAALWRPAGRSRTLRGGGSHVRGTARED